MHQKPRRKPLGFTLIEMMIAMVIVAILTTIALPSYREQIRSSRRTEAENLLFEAASKQQRFFSDNLTYADEMGDLGYGAAGTNAQNTESDAYTVSVSASSGATYTLTATAKNDQVNDGCGNLTLTNTGAKGKSGALPLSICWK